MKTRESGMPDEAMWAGFFDPPTVLAKLGLTDACHDAVEFGCGYGTFTIPAAQIVRGIVHAFDIEAEMVEHTAGKAQATGLSNVQVERRDFVADGTGLPDACVDYAMLFNILHCEQPPLVLGEARRVLVTGGLLAIMHWKHEPTTPRGPSMDIRPTPADCRRWAEEVGFRLHGPPCIDLPPYHYGIMYCR